MLIQDQARWRIKSFDAGVVAGMAKPVARRYSRNQSEAEGVRVSTTSIVEAEETADVEPEDEAPRTVKENNFVADAAGGGVGAAEADAAGGGGDVQSPATIAESPAKTVDAGADGSGSGGDAGDTGAALSYLRKRISENDTGRSSVGSAAGGGDALPSL